MNNAKLNSFDAYAKKIEKSYRFSEKVYYCLAMFSALVILFMLKFLKPELESDLPIILLVFLLKPFSLFIFSSLRWGETDKDENTALDFMHLMTEANYSSIALLVTFVIGLVAF